MKEGVGGGEGGVMVVFLGLEAVDGVLVVGLLGGVAITPVLMFSRYLRMSL